MQKSRIFGSLTLSKLFIVLCAIFTFSINNASGATCTWVECYDAPSFTEYDYSGQGCSTKRERCTTAGTSSIKLTDCTACQSGYTASTTTTTISGCSVSYTTCDYGGLITTSCTSDSDCKSLDGGVFTTVKPGYRAKFGKGICNSDTKICSIGYWYQCDVGYYKSSPLVGSPITCEVMKNINDDSVTFNNCSGCSRCPEFTGDGDSSNEYYGTSDAGTTYARECYVPSGEVFSDTTGKWSFTNDCHNVFLN